MNRNQILIEDQLKKTFLPEHLEVIDESDQHIGHAGHQGGGRHFKVIIKSHRLKQLTLVEAHRQIYAAIADLMREKVHALKIKVIK